MKIVRNKIHTIKATVGEANLTITNSRDAKSKKIKKRPPRIIEITLEVTLRLSKKCLSIFFILSLLKFFYLWVILGYIYFIFN